MLRKHLRASTITGTLTILGATVAVALATGGSSTANILQAFVLGSPNDVRDTNNPLAGAHFDLAAFKAHPCYDIAGIEAELCEEQYGLTGSLRSLLERGVVTSYLQQRGLLAMAVPPAAPVITATPVATTVESAGSIYHRKISERSKRLWVVCRAQAGSEQDARYCYARNVRLLSRFTVAVDEDVH